MSKRKVQHCQCGGSLAAKRYKNDKFTYVGIHGGFDLLFNLEEKRYEKGAQYIKHKRACSIAIQQAVVYHTP